MSYNRIKPGVALVATLTLLLGACSDSSDPGNTNLLSQTEAAEISSDVAQDVDEMLETSTFDVSNGVPLSVEATPEINAAPPAACVTVTPDPVVNSDGDAVPDSVRFDYSACVFTRGNGAITDSLDGTIDIIDPLPAATSLGARHVFTDFFRSRINTVMPIRSFSALHNGTREWGGNADTLGHTVTDFVSVWTHPNGRTTTHEKDWVAKFTATTPGTISLVTPLPAGSITLNGTGSWLKGTRSWSVATATLTPLAYDPTCVVAPRLTAGELELTVTRNTEVTLVNILFTACGQYTVTRTPQ